jgi:hypothetical protein
MSNVGTRRTLHPLCDAAPKGLVAKITEAEGEEGDEFEVMVVVLEGRFAAARYDRGYSKNSDSLSIGVLSHRVMLNECSVWRLVAVPVHRAHAEWAQKAETVDGH